jgi:hypothetical protein
MNSAQWALVVILGVSVLHADAGEQQKSDPSPAQAIAKNEESTELQEIRWLISESCAKNAECAGRAASGFDTSGFPRPMMQRGQRSTGQVGKWPSTPERRRALGLLEDSVTPER